MPWYKVALTNSQVSDGELKRLQDRFMSIYIASKLPKGMAIFADDFMPLNPPSVPGKKPFIVWFRLSRLKFMDFRRNYCPFLFLNNI